ncbi:MAG: NAD(P)-dependent oxidoreductase [Planctomycetota bacterium]
MSSSLPRSAAPPFATGRPHRALLLHSRPEEVMHVLAACEGLEWAAATRAEEVGPALERHDPEVVFSIKTSRFAGSAHATALSARSVRWFHVGGSGRDHLGSWDADRVTVTDSAGVLAPYLAERAMSGLLALSTGLLDQVRAQAERRWDPTRFRPLAGRTMAVLGVGHTGGEVARLARALGMRVLGIRGSGAARPHVDEMFGPDGLDDVLPRADVLSIHLRLDRSTRRAIDLAALARLPEGAIVLNAARGAILDAEALLVALERNVAGAWLDVFDTEPLPPESPLWSHPRVLVSPHCADQVEDFPRRFAERFAALWRGAREVAAKSTDG